MYDPKIARFLQEDTYRGDPNDPLSLNLYAYCRNNPLAYWDPSGNDAELNRQTYIDDRYFKENLINIDAITAISGKNRVYTNPVTGEVTGVVIYNSSDSRFGAYISLGKSNSFKYMPISSSGVGKEQELYKSVWTKKGADGYYIDVSMVEQFSGTKILHKESMMNGIYTIPVNDYYQLKSAGLDDIIIADHLERYYDSKLMQLMDNDADIFDYIDMYYRNLSYLHNSAEELGNICNIPKEEFLKLIDISGGKNLFVNIDYMSAMKVYSLLATRNTRSIGSGPRDPGYYYVNGKKVYYEKPAGYIFEEDAKFALDGSQTAFSVLYPDGKLPWVEETSESILKEASQSAYKAADNVADFSVSNKHLMDAGGRWQKFATTDKSQVNSWIEEGLRSQNAQFSPNNYEASYKIITDLGKTIGIKGETKIQVIIGADGKIWTAYPVK
jgi:hypothetical protein